MKASPPFQEKISSPLSCLTTDGLAQLAAAFPLEPALTQLKFRDTSRFA